MPLSAGVQRAFRRASQRVCQAPWMAFPMRVLHNLDILGGAMLRDPVRAGQAARWGSIRTSAALHTAWRKLDEALSDERTALAALAAGPAWRAWHAKNSITVML